MTRGYPSHWLDGTRGDLKWSHREEVMARMEEKRAAKGSTGGEKGLVCEKAVVVVVPAKPGVGAWWKECREVDGLLDLGWLEEDEQNRLPPRLMLCLSRTQNLGGLIAGARKEGEGRGGT